MASISLSPAATCLLSGRGCRRRVRPPRSRPAGLCKGRRPGIRFAGPRLSRPGRPTDNAFIGAFNGRFRSERLNTHGFLTLADAAEPKACEANRWRLRSDIIMRIGRTGHRQQASDPAAESRRSTLSIAVIEGRKLQLPAVSKWSRISNPRSLFAGESNQPSSASLDFSSQPALSDLRESKNAIT